MIGGVCHRVVDPRYFLHPFNFNRPLQDSRITWWRLIDTGDGCEDWSKTKPDFLRDALDNLYARRNRRLWDGTRMGAGGIDGPPTPPDPTWPYPSGVSNRCSKPEGPRSHVTFAGSRTEASYRHSAVGNIVLQFRGATSDGKAVPAAGSRGRHVNGNWAEDRMEGSLEYHFCNRPFPIRSICLRLSKQLGDSISVNGEYRIAGQLTHYNIDG